VPIGTKFIAVMPSLVAGFVGGADGKPVDREHMGKVIDGYVPPRVADLPLRDKSQWERDDRGELRDPYQLTNELTLIHNEKPDVVYTFTTSSRGGLKAIGEIAKQFGARVRSNPGCRGLLIFEGTPPDLRNSLALIRGQRSDDIGLRNVTGK
jgi:hypothetical protein